MDTHALPLSKMTPQNVTPYGSRAWATKGNFAALHGMALYHLVIEEGCFREPHWHPNADELGYCTTGSALVTIFSHGNQHDQFTIRAF